MMRDRRRVSGVIVRDGKVLMVRERGKGPHGRHDGQEYWTLPGGGVEAGETDEQAVGREVAEEVGLHVIGARFLWTYPYPSGPTRGYAVQVEPGEPQLGTDPELTCDCPRMVGLDWIDLHRSPQTGQWAIPTLLMADQNLAGPLSPSG